MAIALSATSVGASAAPRSMLMLHGIYGRGRNWLTIARRLVERRPDYRCVLVDLPWHGASEGGGHDQTVAGVATDLTTWLDQQHWRPDAILGHSFGGKVALALAASRQDDPLQTWIIDSTPDAAPPAGSGWEMLQAVRGLPDRFASREALVSSLTGLGWTEGVAQWIATNLDRDAETFAWRLDFGVMERLLRSFAETDLWAVVETAATNRTFHFVRATESTVLSDRAVRRLESVGRPGVDVHAIDGGHWIHAERPDALVTLLADGLR